MVRDSELFTTIFHEESHIRQAQKANRGNTRALDMLTGPDALAREEAYVERVAQRYRSMYVRRFGPFKH